MKLHRPPASALAALTLALAAVLPAARADFSVTRFTLGEGIQIGGINDRGLVSGGVRYPDGTGGGFLYDSHAGAFTTTFNYPGPGDFTVASGLNDQGQVVGFSGGNPNHPFVRDSDGTFAPIIIPGFPLVGPMAINDAGQVVGYANPSSPGLGFGFLLDPGGGLTDLGALYVPNAINDRGVIVGTFEDESFIRQPDGTTALFSGPGGAPITTAYGINDQGTIVGELGFRGSARGFIRQADGTQSFFDLPGFDGPTIPIGINDQGQIVGTTLDGMGFIATPVPEPPGLALLGVGLVGVALAVKARRPVARRLARSCWAARVRP